MSKPRLNKVPLKEEIGSWNFYASKLIDGHTRWLVECDCKKERKWLSPSSLHPDSRCRKCADEQKKANYALGKKIRVNEVPLVEEKRAPEGQLSLGSLPKDLLDKASPELKAAIQEGCDAINNAYNQEELLGRKMYIYTFCNVDYNWERLPTVKDYLQDNLFKEQLATMGLKTTDGDFYKTLYLGLESALSIAAALERCLEYAEENLDWDNTFYEEPRIFFVPAVGMSCGFNYGFAWKISDNDAAYIVSPIERPDIEENYCVDKGVLSV